MGKYNTFAPKSVKPVNREIHPVWRGIGLIFIIIIPIMAYYGSLLFIEQNAKFGWFPYPAELFAKGADPYLYIKILATLLIALILYFIFMLITFIIYRIFGPSRYGPLDVPPTAYHGPRYKR